jgi:hypothetical protein
MAEIDASTLFNVKGLVAVVTGGGTGNLDLDQECVVLMNEQVLV